MNSRMSEASSLMSSRDNQPALNTERTADDLTNFIRINTTSVDSGFLCMMCGTLIRQKTNLRRHFLDKHVDDGVHYHCPHCNRTYRSRNSFTSHISATHKDWKKADINKFAVQIIEAIWDVICDSICSITLIPLLEAFIMCKK